MSLKRRIQYQSRYFLQAIKPVSLPAWCQSMAARVVLLAFVALIGAAYVMKTSSAAKTGYELHKLEKQIQSLEAENRKAEIEIADYSSMNSIQERLAGLGMVKAANVKYVSAGGSVVARK